MTGNVTRQLIYNDIYGLHDRSAGEYVRSNEGVIHDIDRDYYGAT